MKLKLPATSANLGPGFDALALALDLFLEIEAEAAAQFAIRASGRNHNLCAGLKRNLLLETYQTVLTAEQRPVVPLAIRMRNGIPIGMGCGSSAAARLAGVALAAHFGGLDWGSGKILDYAAQLEGHPDNVAACWHGGLTVAAPALVQAQPLAVVSIPPPPGWRALLVLPEDPVATAKARGMLPKSYPRQEVVANVQNVALLTIAFALGRGDLMQLATRDRLHQPFRMQLCPLLPALLPLAGTHGVLSVTLSGAGPAVLLLIAEDAPLQELRAAVLRLATPVAPVEILATTLCRQGAGAYLP